MGVNTLGALGFGLVIGWVTYRTLRRTDATGLSDVATVIGAVGGAAVTTLFSPETPAFGMYCIGLAIGFFGYLLSALRLAGKGGKQAEVNEWLGEPPQTARTSSGQGRGGVPEPPRPPGG